MLRLSYKVRETPWYELRHLLSKFFAFLVSGWATKKLGDYGYDTISLKAYSSPEPPVPLNRRGTSHEEIDLA